MPRTRREVIRQNDFSFGEISIDHAASGDRELVRRSLKKARNVRICNGYGFSERFGSRFLNQLTIGAEASVVTSDGSFIAHIRSGGIDFCDSLGAIVQSVEGAPWGAVTAREVVWLARQNELYVAHNDFLTRKLTYSGGIWTLGSSAFATGIGNSISQLYYRFAAKNITLQPSATTGTVNVTFSGSVLIASHVGVRFRYAGKELQIATVTGAATGTATIIDELPPTKNLMVEDASGFRVGEEVQGEDSGAKGTIQGISGNTLTIVITDRWEGFIDTSSREFLIGPNHKSLVVKLSQVDVAPAAFPVWDEQVVSAARGYPGVVFEHAGRLGFADFPQIVDGLAMSSPGTTDDFDVGDGTAGYAIFVRIGESLGQKIKYCVGGTCLFILTDKRCYYVPESADTPLSLATFEFVQIGPTGSSSAYPAVVEEGVVFVESGGNRIMGILATGDFSAPWKLQDLSRHSSHLINNPVSVGLTNGNAQAPERYVFVLNGDGTMAVLFYDAEEPRLGWVPWDTNGSYLALVTLDGIIYSLCQRTVNASAVYFLERFDSACQLDASTLFNDTAAETFLITDAGAFLTTDAGDSLVLGSVTMAHLANETVHVINSTYYLGTFVVGADGVLDIGEEDTGAFEAGYHFTMDAVTWTPEPQYDQRPHFAVRRIDAVAVTTQETGVFAVSREGSANTYVRPAMDQSDDFDAPPPLRSETKRWGIGGWVHEPCIEITRPIPHPVHILAAAMEVAY